VNQTKNRTIRRMPLRTITLTKTCPFQAIYKQGKLCMDTPSVLELFLQLTFPGPTGNAVFTKRFAFSLSLCLTAMFCVYMQEACLQPVMSHRQFDRAS
jgi:hypothetical protein